MHRDPIPTCKSWPKGQDIEEFDSASTIHLCSCTNTRCTAGLDNGNAGVLGAGSIGGPSEPLLHARSDRRWNARDFLVRPCYVPNFCLTARVRYDLIPERARARIRLASSITASQNGRFVAVPERSSCLGLKGDDIRGHLACLCFAYGRTRIVRPSNLFDPGAVPRGRVVFWS